MMVVGLATVAGSTMVAYATILSPVLPNAAGHVLVASIVSAPAGVLLARIIIPEKEGMGGAVADYDSATNTISTAEMFSTTIRPSAVPLTMASMALSYFNAEL